MAIGTGSSGKTIIFDDEGQVRNNYTHTVFVEIGTAQLCEPCHYWSEELDNAYDSGIYDFEYVEMIIFDHNGQKLNLEAYDWGEQYGIGLYPTTIFDANFEQIVGNFPNLLEDALNNCGNRAVANIDASMTVLWLGDATIQVDITINNNENSNYDGHIRASITEIVSRYDDYYGDPYHFGFLDFAFNKDISIGPNGIYTDSVVWNGNDHFDNHGNSFGDIIDDNLQVTMGILDSQTGFCDETVKARVGDNLPPNEPGKPDPSDGETGVDINQDLSWECSDPNGGVIKYDIYFGKTSPPLKVASNITGKSYNPGEMDYKSTYYWKIIAWDDQGATSSGPIWSFLIKEKNNDDKLPNVSIIEPQKGLYLRDKKIFPRIFRPTLIIGKFTIKAEATDEDSGIDKVEFYVNGKYLGNDTTEPYTQIWEKNRIRIFHIFIIKVIAYDKSGLTSIDRMIIKKFL